MMSIDEEIEALVARIRAEHHEPMRPITKIRLAMEAADMLLTMKTKFNALCYYTNGLEARAEKLEAALTEIAYLDSPQIRGLPRRKSISDIASATLEAKP